MPLVTKVKKHKSLPFDLLCFFWVHSLLTTGPQAKINSRKKVNKRGNNLHSAHRQMFSFLWFYILDFGWHNWGDLAPHFIVCFHHGSSETAHWFTELLSPLFPFPRQRLSPGYLMCPWESSLETRSGLGAACRFIQDAFLDACGREWGPQDGTDGEAVPHCGCNRGRSWAHRSSGPGMTL